MRWFIYITQRALTRSSRGLFFKQFSEFSAWLHSVPTTIHGSYLLSACQNSVNSTLAHTRPVGIVVSRAFVFLFKVLKKEAVFII